MKKLTKFLIVLTTATVLTGCGTILQPSTKPITITSDTRAKAYDKDGKYLGKGNNFTAYVSNRRGEDFIKLISEENENDQYILLLEKQHNGKTHWNLLLGGIIGYGVDLGTGGTQRLARTHYAIPDFRNTQNLVNSQVEEVKN